MKNFAPSCLCVKSFSLMVCVDGVLRFDPFDQFVELDRLVGGELAVGDRRSVWDGGWSRSAGGSG